METTVDTVVGGTVTLTAPPHGLAEIPLPEIRGALGRTEAQGTTESLLLGGMAAVAGAQTQAATRGARRVGLVGSLQQPPQVWLETPPLPLLQVACTPLNLPAVTLYTVDNPPLLKVACTSLAILPEDTHVTTVHVLLGERPSCITKCPVVQLPYLTALHTLLLCISAESCTTAGPIT